MELKTRKVMEVKSNSEHTHCFNICECGKIRLPGHQCVFNKCACGQIQLSAVSGAPTGGAFAKSAANRKAGAAFTAIGGTERQKDIRVQIEEDHDAISSNMDKMSNSVKTIRSDVDDLKKYLKNNASAMKKLNSIQEKLNNAILKSLKQEKNKMALKDEKLNELEAALKVIERNQKCIQLSALAGKGCQFLLFLLIMWGIISPFLYQFGVIPTGAENKSG